MDKSRSNADECVQSEFETFHNLDADPADMIRTITDKADAIRTHYG